MKYGVRIFNGAEHTDTMFASLSEATEFYRTNADKICALIDEQGNFYDINIP